MLISGTGAEGRNGNSFSAESMSMNKPSKRRSAAVALGTLVAALVAGCGEAPSPEPVEVVRPVLMQTIGESAIDSGLRFPGRVRAVRRAELAFNVSGELVELPVNE